jgi:hypothetical protein
LIRAIADWLALLGGSRPPRRRSLIGSIALGLWWAVLLSLVFATIGRGSKFIYVDF